MVPDAPKQFVCKLNNLAQAHCARERQHFLRNCATSTGLSRGRKHPKTILLLHSLHSVPRSLNEESRCLMLAPKGAGLKWLAWARRPFLRSEMDQGAKALALVQQNSLYMTYTGGGAPPLSSVKTDDNLFLLHDLFKNLLIKYFILLCYFYKSL